MLTKNRTLDTNCAEAVGLWRVDDLEERSGAKDRTEFHCTE
ncbi:unnamed protein product [Amoebophrya sp. A25]|nr:unnamed protein product [Amoebophrya sp. A25]|eukprot:GSA25T00021790001.1